MSENEKGALKYLLELLIVIIGVFLGVYMSDLQTEGAIRREKEKSITYIIEELTANRDKLKESIQYHESIKPEVDSIINALSEEDLFINYVGNDIFRHHRIKGWSGIGTANLESTAFEAAKISGIIREYDIGFVKEISTLYTDQEKYLKFSNSIQTKMIGLNSSSKVVDVLGAIELLTSDMLSFEKSLLDKYKNIKIITE